MSLRKLIGRLHLWLGLASGLIVFILSVTGCIYVFEKEIKSFVYADRMVVEPAGSPLPISVLWDKAQAALGEERPVRYAQIPGGSDRSYSFSSYKSNPDALTYFGEQVHNFRVFVNPYDGRIIEVENAKYEFFQLVLWTHWGLLLSNKVGQPIVGIAVLIFVVLLLSGLVLWWPRNRAAFKARLRIAWKAKWKRLNWDLHSVPGFYVMALALLIALTGLVWAFDWFDKSVYFIANGGRGPAKEAPVKSDTAAAGGFRPLDAILARVRAEAPGFQHLYLSVPEKPEGVVSAHVRFGKQVNYKFQLFQFDQFTGALLRSRGFSDQNPGEKLRTLNYDLHVGSILGLPGKILAFSASFVCGTLPISGLLIWLGRRRKARGSGSPEATREPRMPGPPKRDPAMEENATLRPEPAGRNARIEKKERIPS